MTHACNVYNYMNRKIASAVTIYRSNKNWMIDRALQNTRFPVTHLKTATAANKYLQKDGGKVDLLIIDSQIIEGSNGAGTRLINTFNQLGLMVIAVIRDGEDDARWANESVYNSTLHLDLLER